MRCKDYRQTAWVIPKLASFDTFCHTRKTPAAQSTVYQSHHVQKFVAAGNLGFGLFGHVEVPNTPRQSRPTVYDGRWSLVGSRRRIPRLRDYLSLERRLLARRR